MSFLPYRLRVLLTFAVFALLVPPLAGRVHAQALDVAVDATFGTGVSTGQGEGESLTARSPMYADIDVGLIFDNDTSTEWGAGFTFQLEQQTAFAVTPQARLVRGEDPLRFYFGVGVPAYLTPFTLFGGEVNGGVLYALNEVFGLIGGAQIDVFFAGSDLPEDGSLLMFNVGAGGRVLF